MLWVFFKLELRMVINQWPQFSPSLHAHYKNIEEFKVDFHSFSIREKKDVAGTWKKFPYLVAEGDIMGVISKCLSDWLTPSSEVVGTSKAT